MDKRGMAKKLSMLRETKLSFQNIS